MGRRKTQSKLFLIATISLITISYNIDVFAEDEIMVEFLEDSYSYNETAVIRVNDPDMSISYDIDYVEINIASDADTIGTTIMLHETDTSGIFEGTIFFVLDDYTSGHRLQIVQGGEIYAAYKGTITSASIEGTPSPIIDTTELKEIPSSLSKTIDKGEKFNLYSNPGDTLYLHEESVYFSVVLHVDYDEKLIDHTAHVWSDSDSEGYITTLTKNNFHNTLNGMVQFSTDSDSLDNKLKVKSGDKIFVKYDDAIISFIVDEYVSPLKQQKSGMTSEQVVCKPDRANMQRPNGSIVCMKFESVSHFVEKGWILMPGELFKGPSS